MVLRRIDQKVLCAIVVLFLATSALAQVNEILISSLIEVQTSENIKYQVPSSILFEKINFNHERGLQSLLTFKKIQYVYELMQMQERKIRKIRTIDRNTLKYVKEYLEKRNLKLDSSIHDLDFVELKKVFLEFQSVAEYFSIPPNQVSQYSRQMDQTRLIQALGYLSENIKTYNAWNLVNAYLSSYNAQNLLELRADHVSISTNDGGRKSIAVAKFENTKRLTPPPRDLTNPDMARLLKLGPHDFPYYRRFIFDHENLSPSQYVNQKSSAVEDRIRWIRSEVKKENYNFETIRNYISEIKNDTRRPERWSAWILLENASGVTFQNPEFLSSESIDWIKSLIWVHQHHLKGSREGLKNVVAIRALGQTVFAHTIKNPKEFNQAILLGAKVKNFGIQESSEFSPSENIKKNMLDLCSRGKTIEDVSALKDILMKYSFDENLLKFAFRRAIENDESIFRIFIENAPFNQKRYEKWILELASDLKVGVSEEMLAIMDSYLSPKARKNIEFIYDASVGNLENVKRYIHDSEISIESKITALKRAVVGNAWEVVEVFGTNKTLDAYDGKIDLKPYMTEMVVLLVHQAEYGNEQSKMLGILARYAEPKVVIDLANKTSIISQSTREKMMINASLQVSPILSNSILPVSSGQIVKSFKNSYQIVLDWMKNLIKSSSGKEIARASKTKNQPTENQSHQTLFSKQSDVERIERYRDHHGVSSENLPHEKTDFKNHHIIKGSNNQQTISALVGLMAYLHSEKINTNASDVFVVSGLLTEYISKLTSQDILYLPKSVRLQMMNLLITTHLGYDQLRENIQNLTKLAQLEQQIKIFPKEFGKFFSALLVLELYKVANRDDITIQQLLDLFSNGSIEVIKFAYFSATMATVSTGWDIASQLIQIKLQQKLAPLVVSEVQKIPVWGSVFERQTSIKGMAKMQIAMLAASIVTQLRFGPKMSGSELFDYCLKEQAMIFASHVMVNQVFLNGLYTGLKYSKVLSNMADVIYNSKALRVTSLNWASFLAQIFIIDMMKSKYEKDTTITRANNEFFQNQYDMEAYLSGSRPSKKCDGIADQGGCYMNHLISGLRNYDAKALDYQFREQQNVLMKNQEALDLRFNHMDLINEQGITIGRVTTGIGLNAYESDQRKIVNRYISNIQDQLKAMQDSIPIQKRMAFATLYNSNDRYQKLMKAYCSSFLNEDQFKAISEEQLFIQMQRCGTEIQNYEMQIEEAQQTLSKVSQETKSKYNMGLSRWESQPMTRGEFVDQSLYMIFRIKNLYATGHESLRDQSAHRMFAELMETVVHPVVSKMHLVNDEYNYASIHAPIAYGAVYDQIREKSYGMYDENAVKEKIKGQLQLLSEPIHYKQQDFHEHTMSIVIQDQNEILTKYNEVVGRLAHIHQCGQTFDPWVVFLEKYLHVTPKTPIVSKLPDHEIAYVQFYQPVDIERHMLPLNRFVASYPIMKEQLEIQNLACH